MIHGLARAGALRRRRACEATVVVVIAGTVLVAIVGILTESSNSEINQAFRDESRKGKTNDN